MNDSITKFPSDSLSISIASKDRAFVKLAAAILEEPEEVILAAVLANRCHDASRQAA